MMGVGRLPFEGAPKRASRAALPAASKSRSMEFDFFATRRGRLGKNLAYAIVSLTIMPWTG